MAENQEVDNKAGTDLLVSCDVSVFPLDVCGLGSGRKIKSV